MHKPKGLKGTRRKLQEAQRVSIIEMKRAMHEASLALDQQTQEIAALKRILISERAQVIYYTDKYQRFINHTCLDLVAKGFLELTELEQTVYIKQAVQELSDAQGLVPHDPEAAAAQKEMQSTGRRLIVPGESGPN